MTHDATLRQIEAADPSASTWVSANAGSGKTRVLTDRVARLLLEGVDPQNILCLTYTKAAASEMQNRLFKRLGAWAMMPAGDLQSELRELGAGGAPDLAEARRLFARAIETPGGLKIQTIHSFCAGVLRRFPLEAGVSPRFTEMEDRAAQLLRAEVLEGLSETRPELVDAVAREFTGADLDGLTAALCARRGVFLAPPPDTDIAALLGAEAGVTASELLERSLDPGTADLLDALARACASGSKTDQTAAEKLAALHGTPLDAGGFDTLCGLFLNGKSAKEPFAAKIGKFPTKAVREANAALMGDVELLMEQVEALREPLLAQRAYERTRVLFAFATEFVPAYEQRKLERGLLDFDDLILKTLQLLTRSELAQWVLYRLDGGIDHILVDEAQDTSPSQWKVIERLAAEFTSGEGARTDRGRTLFVVGDKKQSIYSFQGADAEAFDDMQAHFEGELQKVGTRLKELPLEFSFRSAPAILDLVDRTFTGAEAEGLEREVFHRAFRTEMPGRVDLWPPVEKTSEEEDETPWYEPVDFVGRKHHDVRLAEAIARRIRDMVGTETLPDAEGATRRPVTEGDVLILVQRRSTLFSEIIRACKTQGLKVAGADRLKVGAELAVKDLAALLNFLALPEDDLSLAAALKSPLFGWTEQDLFTLAHHRRDGSYLWPALRDNGAHPETLAVLRDLRQQADYLRPYDLLARILIRHEGRVKLLNRLGAEAEDGIDAMLSQALSYERSAVPSLTGFLTWMQTEDLEIKRQMEAQGDRIRVMTVHGAKGLEAPIVILPDTAKRQRGLRDPVWPAGEAVVWPPLSDAMPQSLSGLKEDLLIDQDRERRRLLYVAMTRAENWLIVAAAGDVGDPGNSWWHMVEAGMRKAGAIEHETPVGPGLRLAQGDWAGGVMTAPEVAAPEKVEAPTFARVAPPETSTGTLSPSDLGGAKILPGDPATGDREAALDRGTRLHLLLEHLPGHPRENWPALAEVLAPGDAQSLEDVTRVLESPELKPLFGEGLAEVPVTAALDALGGRRIHGTVDRLHIGQSVLAVDFKTNRLVPESAEQVPEGLLRQMGAYRAALSQVYPGREIETAILWTGSAKLMRLPAALVDAALLRAGAP